MSRKWAIVGFGSLDAANAADIRSLAVRGPEGVSLVLSLQRAADDGPAGGARQMDRRWHPFRQEGTADENEGEGQGGAGRRGGRVAGVGARRRYFWWWCLSVFILPGAESPKPNRP